MIKTLTCIECPIGCEITVDLNGDKILSLTGNACPRGKLYAQDEVVCPKRVITSTVRAKDGSLVPVKTDKPVKKSEIFSVMEKINAVVCDMPVTMGQVLVENIEGDANLVVSGV
jgi:CxxC motif-containing protein